MSYIRPIFLIAGNTVTGVLRGVVLNVLLVLGALFLIGSMFTGAIDPGQLRATLVDSGLAVITMLGAVIAILTGFTMIPGEIENRTLYPVLSKPVRRWQFVLGKFFGAAGINGITVLLLAVLFFAAYYLKIGRTDHHFDLRLIVAVLMTYAMLCVLSALIIFFSTFMSWIGTIIASMVIWFVGSYSQFLWDMSQGAEVNAFSKTSSLIVQKLLPDFQAMDMRYAIVQENVTSFFTPHNLIGKPLVVGVCYIVIALALATLIFNYREL